MKKTEKRSFPKWIFALIAIGGLVASGIYLGIMSVEGFTGLRFAQSASFGVLGLVMFWGAIQGK
jgi:hypothetical protein